VVALVSKSINEPEMERCSARYEEFGVEGKYIQRPAFRFRFQPHRFKDSGAQLIICVGFMMTDDCKKAARKS
jgi:basic membrane lipoprotein Med (substrate-binding protein (PBP1-ABC) superfamily)